MRAVDYGERRESQPLRPELWIGLELDPENVPFPETVEGRYAYNEVAQDYPKAISLTNRIGIVGKLQTVATILALHTTRDLGQSDARAYMLLANASATAMRPLPISIATPETVEVVDNALDGVLPIDVVTLVLIDLLRLIEGVRP